MQRKREPRLRRLAIVIAILSAPAIASSLGACGTVLELAPPDSDGGEGGTEGSTEGGNADGPSTLDASEVELDGGVACPVSADRTKISMGEVLLGKTHGETVRLTTTSADARTASVVVTGDGFSGSVPPVVVEPDGGASFDVVFSAGDGGAAKATGQLTVTSDGCALPIPLEATRSTANFAVTPGIINLGAVRCGTAPSTTASVDIQSAYGSLTDWAITPLSAPFTLPGGTTGAVPAMALTSIPVGATALPQTPTQIDSVLHLKIGAEAGQRDIQLTVLSQGATLSFNPAPVLFHKGMGSNTTTVTNTGNQAVGVQLFNAAYAFVPSKPFGLNPGESKVITINLVSASPPQTTSVTVSASPALCVPATLTLGQVP